MSIIKDFVVKSGIQVQSTSNSVSTTSGALIVGGGAGFGGGIYVGGRANLGVTPNLQGVGSTTTTGVQTLQVSGGGAGIIDDSFIDGRLGVSKEVHISTTTEATSTTTGALVVGGGIGAGGAIWAHGAIYIDGAPALTAASIANYGVNNLLAGTDTVVNTSTGYVTIWNTSTLQSVTSRGATTTNAINITNTSGSALSVSGGASVGKALTVTGQLIGTTATFSDSTDATTSTAGAVSIAGGLSVTKTIFADKQVISNAGYSLTDVASNALSIQRGGIGVQGPGLFQDRIIVNGTQNSVSTNSNQAIMVAGGLGVGGNIVSGKLLTVDQTPADKNGGGSVQIAGGAYINDNLVINGTEASLLDSSTNALYVVGGVGVKGSMLVGGDTTIAGNLVVNGQTTYVYSTNTYISDSIIDLHVPQSGGHNWTYDDGRDIGIRFNYYQGGDQNAALVFSQDENIFEFYRTGVEDVNGIFSQGAYGTIRAGNLELIDNSINFWNTNSGGLQVWGGAGIGNNLYIEGKTGQENSTTVYRQTLVINTGGLGVNGLSYFSDAVGVGGRGIRSTTVSITEGTGSATGRDIQGLQVLGGGAWISGDSGFVGTVGIQGLTTITDTTNSVGLGTGALVVGGGASVNSDLYVGGTVYGTATYANTATNLAGGSRGGIAYQTESGKTAFITIGTNGYVLTSNGSTATWIPASALTSATATNALNVSISVSSADATYYIPFASTSSGFSPDYADVSLTYNPGTHVVTFGGTLDSTTSTTGTIIVSGGIGVAKSVTVAGTLTAYQGVVSSSVVADSVYDSGNRVVTSVTPTAGAGIAITALSSSGTAATFTVANFGVTSLTAGTDTTVSGSTGSVTIWANSTLQSVTDRGTTTTNAINILNGTQSSNTTTGALVVAGGVGIGSDLNVGGRIVRTGNVTAGAWGESGIGFVSTSSTYTDQTSAGAQGLVTINKFGTPTIAATGGTPTYSDAATLQIADAPKAGSGVTITNPWAVLVSAGNVKISTSTVSASTVTGALVVGGGIGAGGAIYAGGLVQAGTASTGSSVNGFVSNNLLIASYTSAPISSGGAVTLDVWPSATYRTAKYMVQLVDTGFTPARVHATEMLMFHDGSGNVYKSEYGIVTNLGELGTFDAVVSGGNVQLSFTPSATLTPTTLVIKAYRTSITA